MPSLALRGDIFIDRNSLADKVETNSPRLPTGNERIFYVDEVGVLPDRRQEGIAALLLDKVVRDLGRGAWISIARTKAEPPSDLYGWFLRRGQQEVGRYDDDSGRVVLEGRTQDLMVQGLEL